MCTYILKNAPLNLLWYKKPFQMLWLKISITPFFLRLSELTASAGVVLVYRQLVLGCTGRLKSASLEAEG